MSDSYASDVGRMGNGPLVKIGFAHVDSLVPQGNDMVVLSGRAYVDSSRDQTVSASVVLSMSDIRKFL